MAQGAGKADREEVFFDGIDTSPKLALGKSWGRKIGILIAGTFFQSNEFELFDTRRRFPCSIETRC